MEAGDFQAGHGANPCEGLIGFGTIERVADVKVIARTAGRAEVDDFDAGTDAFDTLTIVTAKDNAIDHGRVADSQMPYDGFVSTEDEGNTFARAIDTNGSVALFELTVPAAQRLAAPVHSHDHYEETIYGI